MYLYWNQIKSLITLTITDNKGQFDNFVVTGGTVSCRNDNLRCHRWQQSCQIDDLLFSVIVFNYTVHFLNILWNVFYNGTLKRHLMVHPQGWGVGCFFGVRSLNKVLAFILWYYIQYVIFDRNISRVYSIDIFLVLKSVSLCVSFSSDMWRLVTHSFCGM